MIAASMLKPSMADASGMGASMIDAMIDDGIGMQNDTSIVTEERCAVSSMMED